ncbi:Serine carboxypeptidase 3 [Friedmanniomyces endolithicus]|nr:Serine carboxypeptidase 3 [Friedmanniomyces endolithicus]KAK0294226.1 Serine carboxypeptidase 3 [Friedmanniomyces endolithicus]KAK1003310.1 Serine carboxypeptidase 3 [Friedmanniomyces endolithicus]
MAASSVCASCLRALRLQSRTHLPPPSRSPLNLPQRQHALTPSPRALSTSTRHLAQQQSPQPKPSTATPPPPPPPPPAAFAALATTLRASTTPLLRSTTEPYAAYGSTELLFQSCAAQCSYTIPSLLLSPPQPPPKNAAGEDIGVGEGWWVTPKSEGGLGLEVTFNTWAQVVMLHMYLVTVRLRGFPAEHVGVWHQNLLDHFFYAAEDRMAVWHGMVARSVRNKYLKDLWLQWRGLLLSYDEGLVRGDAVLGAAVWRNVFRAGEGEGVVGDVGPVVGYMRRELGRLGEMGDGEIAEGKVGFGKSDLKGLGARESPWMRKSFTVEDLKEVEVRQ